jgi:hypothetical protein
VAVWCVTCVSRRNRGRERGAEEAISEGSDDPFSFFWYTRRRRVRGAGPDGPDEELEGAEIGFNYFTG